MEANLLGSIMVVGGGIAGMQAALALAHAGYYLHLVKKKSAISGTMMHIGNRGVGRERVAGQRAGVNNILFASI